VDIGTVARIARKEVRDALRNRWFILYAAAFAILALALSRLALVGETAGGYVGFGRTAASLVNLVLLVVPLMGLTLGAASLAAERESGTLATLLAQPVTRAEVLLAKFVGLALALTAALALGFGVAGALISAGDGAIHAAAYAVLVGFAVLLALSMLSVGLMLSSFSRRSGTASGLALSVWLTFGFLGDLGVLGTALTMRLDTLGLFALTVFNPLESFKVAAVSAMTGTLDVLGPAGTFATRTFGDGLLPLLGAVLVAWCAAPLGVAGLVFSRRPIR
jgi:Cu-processing system permease protein